MPRSFSFLFVGLVAASLSLLVLSSKDILALTKCTICHGKRELRKIQPTGKLVSLYVDEWVLQNSVHAKQACTDCHSDVVEIPHKGKLVEKVNCTRCHYRGNPAGAPQMVKYTEYAESVHGIAARAGNQKAPVCQDCHGAHNVRKHADPQSGMWRGTISETCGRCHLEVYSVYRESIHGRAVKEGKLDSAVCTDCHGEHSIKSPENPESTVYLTNIPQTCPKCHAPKGIASKYGIKTGQVKTFEDSFHGIGIKFGMKTVASCASCHGVHDIRAADDLRSTVHIKNIPTTCGKCHSGANINYAKGRIHVDPKKKESGAIFYVSFFFKWLTISVMLGLLAHMALDLSRRARERKR
ncbi:MAG: cytochrome c3 family protein [Candidatus Eisenbacteria bacterium]|nr:cytochrome c3 family protein [Candidatus Eisenbacteria bacterium]